MQKKTIAVGEVLRFSWETIKTNTRFFFAYWMLLLVIYLVPQLFVTKAGVSDGLVNLVSLLFWVIEMAIAVGFIQTALLLIRHKQVSFQDLYKHLSVSLVARYIAVLLLVGVIVVAGIICLIVPGIILAIRLQFAGYLVIDKNMGMKEALVTSWQMTKEYGWSLFVLALVLLGLNIIGILVFVIGVIATMTIQLLSMTYTYTKLSMKN